MATLAKAYVQIVPSAEGIKAGIEKEIDPDGLGKGVGASLGASIKTAIATAGIGMAVKKIFSDAFSNGGELQQNLGGTEAVFGNFASSIQESASSAYKNMGLSASDYMATANKMGSLFQGSGLSQQRSLELTSSAMQRAADVASVMGIDTTMAMESIAGAAKGNFTMMDNLGVAMNATTLQAYALEKGINFEWNTASNAEKAELAMKMFMDRTSQYSGSFARESEETWSGSVGAMKASYQDLMANIMLGENVGTALQNLVTTITTFVSGNLLPAIVNIVSALPQVVVTLIGSLAPAMVTSAIELVTQLGTGIANAAPMLYEGALSLISNLQNTIQTSFPQMLQTGVGMITNIVNGILNQIPNLISSAVTLVTGFLSAVLSSLPQMLSAGVELLLNIVNGIIETIPEIVSAATKSMFEFLNKVLSQLPDMIDAGIQLLSNLVDGIIASLPQIVDSALQIISDLASTIKENLPTILQKGIEILIELASGLVKAIPDAVAKIPEIISAIGKAFIDFEWGSVGMNIIKGIASGISGAADAIVEAAKEAARNALQAAKDFLGIHSPSRVFRDQIGKMTALGFAEGISVNTDAIKGAVKEAKESAVNTFDIDAMHTTAKYGMKDYGNGYDNILFSKFDKLLDVLEEEAMKDKKTVIVVNDRQLGRTLREMGVVMM